MAAPSMILVCVLSAWNNDPADKENTFQCAKSDYAQTASDMAWCADNASICHAELVVSKVGVPYIYYRLDMVAWLIHDMPLHKAKLTNVKHGSM